MGLHIALLNRRHFCGSFVLAVAAVAAMASPIQAKTTADDAAGASHAPRAANVAAVSSVVFGGVTSGHWPAVFSISSDDKRLFAGAIVVDMSCASGESFAVPDEFVGNRRFRPNGTIRFVKPIAPFATPGGSLISGSRSIAVRLNRKRMTLSGTWRLHLDFTFVNGQTDHCDSGQVHVSTRL